MTLRMRYKHEEDGVHVRIFTDDPAGLFCEVVIDHKRWPAYKARMERDSNVDFRPFEDTAQESRDIDDRRPRRTWISSLFHRVERGRQDKSGDRRVPYREIEGRQP